MRQARIYRDLLDGLSHDEVMGAIRRHVRQGERWRPSPGEIVALAGRAVALPPFGPVREALIQACRTGPVRLARGNVTEPICLMLDHPLAEAFVRAVGGERIRRAALYVSDETAERMWQALARDYEGMRGSLADAAFAALPASEHRELTP